MLKTLTLTILITIPTVALAQTQTICQRIGYTIQCQTYGQQPTPAPAYQGPSTSDMLIRQMLSSQAINGFQQGQHDAECRRARAMNVYAPGC